MAAKKKDLFDSFLEKNFGSEEQSQAKIARPSVGERTTSFEERRQLAEQREREEQGRGVTAEPAAPSVSDVVSPAGGEEVRVAARPGRPKVLNKPETTNMNFIIEKSVKYDLEQLKLTLHRRSVTDLRMEAIHDLFVKYGVENS